MLILKDEHAIDVLNSGNIGHLWHDFHAINVHATDVGDPMMKMAIMMMMKMAMMMMMKMAMVKVLVMMVMVAMLMQIVEFHCICLNLRRNSSTGQPTDSILTLKRHQMS